MELKLSNDTNTGESNSGLRLSGAGNNQPGRSENGPAQNPWDRSPVNEAERNPWDRNPVNEVERNPWDRNPVNEAERHPVQESAQNPWDPVRETNENPWDYNPIEEPIITSSISQTSYSDGVVAARSNNETILNIAMIVTYVAAVFEIVSLIWVVNQSAVDVQSNMMTFQGIYGLCTSVFIIDAILVNVLYKKKISLIILAWVFYPAYLIKRSKYVGNSTGFARLCCFGFIAAMIAYVVFFYKAFTGYGGIVAITDDAVRKESAFLMDQVDASGQRIGDKVMRNVKVTEAYMEEQNGVDVVVLVGAGKIKMDGDTFIDTGSYNVDTCLGFVKMEDGTYEIQAVALGETGLTSYGATSYWNSVIQ